MAETKKPAKEGAAPTERAYDLAVLRENSAKLLGVTSSTFDGAMSGRNGQITLSEAKGIIETWKKGVAR